MQKLETLLADQLTQKMQNEYSFTMNKETAIGISRSLINTYKRNVELPNTDKKTQIRHVLDKYYATTKMPNTERQNHSCWFFKEFIEAHYFFLLIPKNRMTRWFNKIFHYWTDPI